MRMVKSCAKAGCTRPASFSRPPERATAITPRTGSPTALIKNPAAAGIMDVPACTARKGGNIRLPAPKNMEKSVNPTINTFFPDKRSLLSIAVLLPYYNLSSYQT